MYWDVKVVKPLSDYNIYVEIEDGRKGKYLDKSFPTFFRRYPLINQGGSTGKHLSKHLYSI